jgi:WD40 repeat protein
VNASWIGNHLQQLYPTLPGNGVDFNEQSCIFVIMSRASSAAADYAAKKKAQMEHAAALKAQRKGPAVHGASIMQYEAKHPHGEVTNVGGMQVECQSLGSNTEKITISRPAGSRKPLPQMHASDANDGTFDSLDGTHHHGFLRPPLDPTGVQVNLSERPILCASYDSERGEAVFGTADHGLYAVSVNNVDSKRGPKVVQMYSKKYGHTDWITSVAHMTDGRVISASMDGKLCLWDAHDRSRCVDLIGAHTKSISKVVACKRSNNAISCGYDQNVVLWKFDEMAAVSADVNKSRMKAVPKAASPNNFTVMTGHKEAIVECALFGDATAISGDRKGGLVMWDLTTGKAMRHINAGHRGSISQLHAMGNGSRDDGSESGSHMFLSAGVDGMVRLWDARCEGQKPALEIPAHATIITEGGRTGISGAAISCIAQLAPRGSGSLSGIVTGGADSIVCLLDARMSFGVVERWAHHRTGIYAIHTVDDDCIFSGDGAGMLHCYSTNFSSTDSPPNKLRYGLGCSESGAVRAIGRIGDRIVTGGEDGKALILSY